MTLLMVLPISLLIIAQYTVNFVMKPEVHITVKVFSIIALTSSLLLTQIVKKYCELKLNITI